MPRADSNNKAEEKQPIEEAEISKKTEDVGGGSIAVGLKKVANVNGKEQPSGFKLADVKLAPGVTMNYLVDAWRNGLAVSSNDNE